MTETQSIQPAESEPTPDLLELRELEKVIERGLATFVEVGNALIKIKIGRKYKHAGFSTFEEYCQGRWGITPQHGNRLAIAAATAESLARDLEPRGSILPTTEKQVRPLASLPESERAEAWTEAVAEAGGAQPTAAQVTTAAEKRKPKPAPESEPHSTTMTDEDTDEDQITTMTDEEKRLHAELECGNTVVVSYGPKYKTLRWWAKERGLLVAIDCGTIWANPFVYSMDGDRVEVVNKFRDYYLPHKPGLISLIDQLRGKALVCGCAPGPCHGDVLRDMANGSRQ